MASLSVHGIEIARFESPADPRTDGGHVTTVTVLMSDAVVLEKVTWYKRDGRVDFSDGWKIAARRMDPTRFVESRTRLGWEKKEPQ